MIKKIIISLIFASLIGFALYSAFPKEERIELVYIGSSTIGEKIMPKANKIFKEKTGFEFAKIEVPGSGKGIEAALKDKNLIAGSSRPLTQKEKEQKPYYMIIGYDAVGIFVHKENPVRSITKDQLKKIFTGEIKNWVELGGKDEPIAVITEIWGEKRGTMVEFQNQAMDGEEYSAERTEVDRPADQVRALEMKKNGIISVSLSFENEQITPLNLDNISPTKENVRSGAYLLSRPLILLKKDLPTMSYKTFFDFIISSEGQKIIGEEFITLR